MLPPQQSSILMSTGTLKRRVGEDYEKPFVGWDLLQSSHKADTARRDVGNMLHGLHCSLNSEIFMKKHLLIGDCFPLGECCWNLCAQAYGSGSSRSTIITIVYCRGGSGIGFLGGKKFLDTGWETRFLLQNTSSPGSTEIKAGVVLLFPTWSDSWCNLEDQKWHYYPITLL